MPVAIPDDEGGGPTTGEAAGYAAALEVPPGDRTAAEQAAIAAFEAKMAAISGGWKDSGGPGGFQAKVALEVGRFVGQLEAARQQSVNQWAKEAARGSRKAQAEMHGADSASLVTLARLVYELRERLNVSPY